MGFASRTPTYGPVIDKTLGEILVAVGADDDVADLVVLVAEVLYGVASTGSDVGQETGRSVAGLLRDNVVAVGLLTKMAFGIKRVGLSRSELTPIDSDWFAHEIRSKA